MKWIAAFALSLLSLQVCAHAADVAPERLGTVSFAVSCAPGDQKAFDRGVALLHDFWYEEADSQFQKISENDPGCAMAHWGAAMSYFHQIWDRPNAKVMERGWAEIEKAKPTPALTTQERLYIDAISRFYEPSEREFQARIDAYSERMEKIYSLFPDDPDAGAFYALSLLAARPPGDTSLAGNRKALEVLVPLFAKNPDHPGVVHYIIHACDTPSLAPQGLAAAQRYGEIAPSAPHAAHMPGHIFARLGMWQADIDANVASVAASQSAEAKHQSGAVDQFHSNDFLLYAYLQSGQDARAKEVLNTIASLLTHFEAMPEMTSHRMEGMLPYYRTKFPVFYSLEMRDWKSALALEPVARALPESQTLTYWARIVAAGHLHQPEEARKNLASYEALMAQARKGKNAYVADSTGAKIEHGEVLAWVAFAEGNQEGALTQMRDNADLQDKVGQGEVDIPAREMLADMLLDFHHPKEALTEYDRALKMSPNRFNGLANAGLAAEAAGDPARAASYYATLLKVTNDGSQSTRPELAHGKTFLSTTQLANK